MHKAGSGRYYFSCLRGCWCFYSLFRDLIRQICSLISYLASKIYSWGRKHTRLWVSVQWREDRTNEAEPVVHNFCCGHFDNDCLLYSLRQQCWHIFVSDRNWKNRKVCGEIQTLLANPSMLDIKHSSEISELIKRHNRVQNSFIW